MQSSTKRINTSTRTIVKKRGLNQIQINKKSNEIPISKKRNTGKKTSKTLKSKTVKKIIKKKNANNLVPRKNLNLRSIKTMTEKEKSKRKKVATNIKKYNFNASKKEMIFPDAVILMTHRMFEIYNEMLKNYYLLFLNPLYK